MAASCRLQASSLWNVLVKSMKDFKKLMVWQLGMDIVDKVYDVVTSLPSDEKYGIRSQLTRCAVSIPGNIAEGSAKKSDKEYRRYAEIALGSSFELETHLLIVQQQRWLPEDKVEAILALTIQEQKMLTTFIAKL